MRGLDSDDPRDRTTCRPGMPEQLGPPDAAHLG